MSANQMTNEPLKLLVVEGYAQSSREDLTTGGMTVASVLYKQMLLSIAPNAVVDVVTPADTDTSLPAGVELRSYDGATMTGSNLSVMDSSNPSVRSQVELQREIFKQGVPSFGSCWALQVGTVAAGGKVGVNPKGREMGFARKIKLTESGLKHPMYKGKQPVFDSFASHEDEIVEPPPNSKVLSGNAISEIQALEISCDRGVMWTVQYHPEYNTKEMAALMRCREERLIAMGFFSNATDLEGYAKKLDELYDDPQRKDSAWNLGIDSDILDVQIRQLEVRNWIENLVLPNIHC